MLSDLTKQFNESRAEFQTKIKEAFKAELATLTFPERIKSVGWVQYTPYFNDGDVCTFSVNLDHLFINRNSKDDLPEEEDYFNEYIYKRINGKYEQLPNPNLDIECANFISAVINVVGQVPEEIMKEVFGDHVTVHYTRDGFEVEDYEHE